jgi:hypothetical protein
VVAAAGFDGPGWAESRTDPRDVEIAVLRHQPAVLHRQVELPRYTPSDRLVLVWLAKLLPRQRWSAFLVTSTTLLRWHRDLIARRWTGSVAFERSEAILTEYLTGETPSGCPLAAPTRSRSAGHGALGKVLTANLPAKITCDRSMQQTRHAGLLH